MKKRPVDTLWKYELIKTFILVVILGGIATLLYYIDHIQYVLLR